VKILGEHISCRASAPWSRSLLLLWALGDFAASADAQVDHDRKFFADLIATATRTLYDERAIAGSSQGEAEKAAAEVCKRP
jgi:hypothetical protein